MFLFQVISTTFGLILTFDTSNTLEIKVPSALDGNTCGLCGTKDGNPYNDFRLLNGSVVSS